MTRAKKILWISFWSFLSILIFIFVGAIYGLFGKMPSMQELQNPEADLASEIYTADGLMMGKFYRENRSEVKFGEISPNVINALIATEDERFFDHSGIDVEALGRVIYTFGSQGGGSTITQQLAKMILGQGKGNMAVRSVQKLKEWIVAVKLERNFTKEEIITLYLNRAAWGNVYGIRNASRTYFQKEPKDLKIEEAAVLVGMLKGFIYDPVRHPDKSKARRNVVLNQMTVARQRFLSQSQADSLKNLPLVTNYKKIDEEIGIAPYYRNALAEELKKWCLSHRNPKTNQPYDIYKDGLKIYTTIDSRMQKHAEEAVNAHMPVIQKKLYESLKWRGGDIWKGHESVLELAMRQSERWKIMQEDGISPEEIKKTFFVPVKMKVFTWNNKAHEKDTTMTPYDSIKYQKLLLQTSFAAMDPKTGEIKAWVGGIDYKWFKYDHVSAMRQVGSTFKPLLYTLAVTDRGYTPESIIAGGPLTLAGKTISTGGGTMAYCLANSLNGAAWHIMGMIGVKRTIEFARQCGIVAKIPNYPSIALGAVEIPMVQMLQAYTMFPNKGFNTPAVYFTRIEDKDGNLIYENPVAQAKELISPAEAFTMVKMMQGVIGFGTAKRLKNYNIGVQMAGKTGTTNDNTDGWFIGYTPELLAGTWVGCEDPFIPVYSNNSGGAEMSAPKWGEFMKRVYSDKNLGYGKLKEFEKPAELTNDPIYADINFATIATSGDSLNVENDDQNSGYMIDEQNDINNDTEKDDPFDAPNDDSSKSNLQLRRKD